MTATHDYELPALGGLFSGPLGVLPDLDAVIGSKHRKHNLGHEEGLCHFLHTMGLSQTDADGPNSQCMAASGANDGR